ncbi:4Fe-4S binding protein [bacterium]|nr:4Fe-4S binding protein [bacterium]
MKRYIVKIDESKCNGCGICTKTCISQAIQVIEGKAKLVSETYCDGFGTCAKKCPQQAISLEFREADNYSEAHVMENISKYGQEAITRHLKQLKDLEQKASLDEAMLYLEERSYTNMNYTQNKEYNYNKAETTKTLIKNTLATNYENACKWPIRLDILFPDDEALENANLVIAADCAPFVYKDFETKFLKEDNVLIILCPKSENTIGTYVGKLAYIFEQKNIKSISIVRMESECCDEIEKIVKKALAQVNITMMIKEYVVALSGERV